MKFCSKCFRYNEIIEMIESNEKEGNCTIQETHKNVYVCDTESNQDLFKQIKNVLLDIIDLYTPVSEVSGNKSLKNKMYLWDALYEKWSIFNLNVYHIENLLRNMFEDDSDFNQLMFQEKVLIPQENEKYDDELIVKKMIGILLSKI